MQIERESIFISALRSFFNAFFVILGLAAAIFGILILIGMFSNTLNAPNASELTVSPDASGNREILPETAPVLLRIDIRGVIGDKKIATEQIEKMLLDSREGILKNSRVKGILIYMDSPGGSALDSDGIYRAFKAYRTKYNTPIYAYVDGLCASGGMYIACAADKILATPTSTIGSVGVRISTHFNLASAMDKVGVQSMTLTEGKNKDELNPFRPWKPDEGKSLQQEIGLIYDRFVSIVTANRPRLSRQKLINDYGADVFISAEAEKRGYIDDGNSDYSQTVHELAQVAGIVENENYQVVLIEPYRPVLADLAQNQSRWLRNLVADFFSPSFGSHIDNERYLYHYQP